MSMTVRWCAVVAACVLVAAARADLPPGFVRTFLAPESQVGVPTSLGVLPDGRILVGDYYGRVTLITIGQPVVTLLQLGDVVAGDDHGLLGLAVDPAAGSNGFFYIFYTRTGPYDIVVRYTLAGNSVDPASRTVIWRNPDLCPGFSHHGGSLNFGPDGNLYITTGEQYDNAMNAQTLANQHGKVLRLAPDGSIPPDNPFVNTPGAQAAIWAYGLRNPYRSRIDEQTGYYYIADVGDGGWEELDRLSLPGSAGANLGWPFMEGPHCNVSDCSPYTAPLFAYSHQDLAYTDGDSACVICGPVYRGTQFPAEYRGNLFYADWVNGWIRRLTFDADGNITGNIVFDTGPSAWGITDMRVGPDGALYYCTNNGGASPTGVYRISATGGNLPATVVADAQPRRVDAGQTVSFSSAGTIDPDGGPQPLSFLWNFGDGDTSDIPNPTHTYASRGLYQVTLVVFDGADPASSAPIAITVGHAPAPVINTPAPGTPYSAGDTISFSGSATDVEDGVLPASAFSWSITLVHLTHTHNVEGPITGVTSDSFVIPTSGHDPENTHFRVDLTVTDSDGIPASTSVDLSPNISVLSVGSLPSGIPIFIDGRALQTPRDYESIVGFQHELAAPDSFVLNGRAYFFQTWSFGQSNPVEIVSPAGGMTITAIYSGCGTADFNCDGDIGTDSDIEAFFTCLAGTCPAPPCANSADFNGDGDVGTDADIEAFFRILAGGAC